MVGTVVSVMYFICLKRFEPVTAAAKLVVSLKGDILSPKYAPDIIAPATTPRSNPNAFPIPIRPIPIVAVVDQLLPVARATIELMITQVGKKKEALINLSP